MAGRFALVLASPLLLSALGASTSEGGLSRGDCAVDRDGTSCIQARRVVPKEHLLLQQAFPFHRRGESRRSWVKSRLSPGRGDPGTEVTKNPKETAAACDVSTLSRRRRGASCFCRRRTTHRHHPYYLPDAAPLEDHGTGWRCRGRSMVREETQPSGQSEACLCVFDIDRTLTGKQEKIEQCPRNRIVQPPVVDKGYGSGEATLSALAAAGINTTFCNQCYLGITSAGHGSGEHSAWNAYILEHVMRGQQHDAFRKAHPESQRWSFGANVQSPYVLGQGNKLKQYSVDLIRRWYSMPERGIRIKSSSTYFFGDRTENIEPFRQMGINSREISCSSRDPDLYGGSGLVGYCGATPEEIKREQGNILCNSR